MINKELTMYCVCFGEDFPRHEQYNQKNIMANSFNLDPKKRVDLRKQGFIFDDEGRNISYLNYAFGDLTATYWIWKNAKEEFVGTNHYRRFWVEEEMQKIEFDDKTIYISAPERFFDVSTYQQYLDCHGPLGINILNNLFKDSSFPLKKEVFDGLHSINYMSGCNMFFCHKVVYNRICEILFGTLFPVFSQSIEQIGEMDYFQRRMVAYLSERIITAIMLDPKYYFGNVGVVSLPFRKIL